MIIVDVWGRTNDYERSDRHVLSIDDAFVLARKELAAGSAVIFRADGQRPSDNGASVLALDLATNTGWAAGGPSEAPRFGTHTLPSTGDDVGRFLHVHRDWLSCIIKVQRPSMVVYEAPILPGQTNKATVIKLMSLAGLTELVCRDLQVRCFEVHLQSVKKFLAGSGRATKADMVAAARRFGFDVRNDNEADAIAIWGHAVSLKFPGRCDIFSLGQLGATGDRR